MFCCCCFTREQMILESEMMSYLHKAIPLTGCQVGVSACVLSRLSHVQLCDSYGLQPFRPLYPWNSPDKNPGVGCHALLQGIFQTLGSNPCLLCFLHWQVGSFTTSNTWKPKLGFNFFKQSWRLKFLYCIALLAVTIP